MIMDKFNCKHCGKLVVFENEEDVGIDRYDVNCSCPECFNKYELPIIEYEDELRYEWESMQGNYLG